MENFCSSTVNIWMTIGNFINVFKVVIPILLIVLGTMDLGKAVVSSKDDEIKKSTSRFARRILAAICIFFLPTIIYYVFGLVDLNIHLGDECKQCMLHPEKCQSIIANK